MGFGANLILSQADGARAWEALSRLDFYLHTDLGMNSTAELADIVLPVASAWKREALKVGFEVSQEAEGLVQLRQPVVAALGEARSDTSSSSNLHSGWGLDVTSGTVTSMLAIATFWRLQESLWSDFASTPKV